MWFIVVVLGIHLFAIHRRSRARGDLEGKIVKRASQFSVGLVAPPATNLHGSGARQLLVSTKTHLLHCA